MRFGFSAFQIVLGGMENPGMRSSKKAERSCRTDFRAMIVHIIDDYYLFSTTQQTAFCLHGGSGRSNTQCSQRPAISCYCSFLLPILFSLASFTSLIFTCVRRPHLMVLSQRELRSNIGFYFGPTIRLRLRDIADHLVCIAII